ncbi:Microcystin-dependent protein [Chitinophaga sp. CF118]|uniref:phage tail protein n=1 Tax=Chitinophaga sp. CF118 TaxID=1884367 RepID=UPI0008E37B68|nr:tail fiber protein [Chitinophaga sp. CF118]SFD79546.1 Microcystin-dependent protein [Chitinophaga sp. CF118]
MDFYVGEIRLFPYNRIPADWMACNGQLLQISQHAALYSLIGVFYGGDAKFVFNLPNLNGRAIVGFTSGTPSGTVYKIGQAGGTENVVLTIAQIPLHTHSLAANNTYDSGGPNTHYLGNPNIPTAATQASKNAANANLYAVPAITDPLVPMAPCIATAGSSAGHENRSPYLAMNYCIAITGLYPTRS